MVCVCSFVFRVVVRAARRLPRRRQIRRALRLEHAAAQRDVRARARRLARRARRPAVTPLGAQRSRRGGVGVARHATAIRACLSGCWAADSLFTRCHGFVVPPRSPRSPVVPSRARLARRSRLSISIHATRVVPLAFVSTPLSFARSRLSRPSLSSLSRRSLVALVSRVSSSTRCTRIMWNARVRVFDGIVGDEFVQTQELVERSVFVYEVSSRARGRERETYIY